jgi:UDP-glucose 4-epimerase
MKYLILGSSGFIGSDIKERLLLDGAEVIAPRRDDVDLSSNGAASKLASYIDSDTHLIFCAGIKRQLGDNFRNYIQNERITSNLCEALSVNKPKHLLFLSTAAVYGENDFGGVDITERNALVPSSYYSISKINSENILSKIGEEFQFPTCFARIPLVYGRGDRSLGYGPTGFCYRAARGEEIVIWGDGQELREFLWIEDLARICVELSMRRVGGSINTVSGQSYSFAQVLDILRRVSRKPIRVTFKPRTKERSDVRFSPILLQKTLGYFSFTPLDDGVLSLYKQFSS